MGKRYCRSCGVKMHAEGKMVLCSPATNLSMMLAWLALGLCVGPGLPHVALV